jgi:predicted PurR-regulated permease PerM
MNDSQQQLITRTLTITLTILATVTITLGLFYFIFVVRAIVLDLVIALILAAALQPCMKFLQRKKLGKISASLISILVVLIVVGGMIGLIITPLINEGSKLALNTPEIFEQISNNTRLNALNDRYHIVQGLSKMRDQFFGSNSGQSVSVLGIATGVIGGITSTVAIIIFVFFLLVDGPIAWEWFVKNFSVETQKRIDSTGRKLMKAISGFVSGNLFISLIAGLLALIILLIFHVPYAFALAALVAVLDLLPLIGTTLATIVIGLVALTKGILIALLIIAIFIVYQFVENHFIQPLVYSRSIRLPALLVIVATLAGAKLAGVIGVLLAIPTAAVIQIIAVELFSKNSPPSQDGGRD